jgi:hypothetical protein
VTATSANTRVMPVFNNDRSESGLREPIMKCQPVMIRSGNASCHSPVSGQLVTPMILSCSMIVAVRAKRAESDAGAVSGSTGQATPFTRRGSAANHGSRGSQVSDIVGCGHTA